MLFQVMRDYPSLGDYRRLTMPEIRVLYDGLRASLRKVFEPPSK